MPKRVPEQYDELMHYTTGAGLLGILESGVVRATHASFLNDSFELTHFFDSRLPDLASAPARRAIERMAEDESERSRIERFGGIDAVVEDAVKAVVSSLRSTTLRLNRPHIFSLSTPIDEHTRQNGLLSQWRGYGMDGGYAIVLDAQRFEELLVAEEAAFDYTLLSWGDVYYYGMGSDQPAMEEVATAEATIDAGVEKFVRGDRDSAGDMYFPISLLSPLYKHRGFAEEREVRVIAIPAESKDGDAGNAPDKTMKELKFLSRNGLLVPYIELFSRREKLELPIKRVIVGPHRERAIRKDSVEMLLQKFGYEVEVVLSDTSYVGK